MKIRKNAEQKNFIVNKDFYTEHELVEMAREKTIFCIDEQFDVIYITNIRQVEDCCFRIFADMCKEVKVVYDKTLGCYKTVVITDNDKIINICL